MKPTISDGELAIVGEGPGRTADKYGEHGIGRSGKLLHSWAEDADVDIGFIQTAVRCGSDKPTIQQCRLCRPFLLRDLNKHQPKRIVGLGVWASKALQNTSKTTITKDRNRELKVPGLEYEPELVTLTYNPAAFIHGNDNVPDYVKADLKRAVESSRVKKQIIQCKSIADIKELVQECKNNTAYAIDIESSLDGKILIVGVGFKNEAWWFPVDHSESPWDFSEVSEYIYEIFGTSAIKLGHNFMHDMKFVAKWGVNTKGRILDTLILIRMIQNDYIDKSLEHILLRFFNYPDYAAPMRPYKSGFKIATGELTPTGRPQMKTVYDYGKAPMKILGDYCAWDAAGTFDIARKYVPKAKKQKWWKLYWDVYMKAEKVLIRSVLDGFRMNPKELDNQKNELKKEAETLKKKFIKLVKLYWYRNKIFRFKAGGYDPNNDDLNLLLYRRMKFPVEVQTKSRKPAVNKKAIKQMLTHTRRGSNEWKILSCVVGWKEMQDDEEVNKYGLRQYDKLLGSFIQRLTTLSEKRGTKTIQAVDGSGFRIPAGDYFQPGYTIAGAVTGRLTSKPNIQNWPRKIRKAFVSRWK